VIPIANDLSTPGEIASLLAGADPETIEVLTRILQRDGITSGCCFSQYCNGNFHAHAPTHANVQGSAEAT